MAELANCFYIRQQFGECAWYSDYLTDWTIWGFQSWQEQEIFLLTKIFRLSLLIGTKGSFSGGKEAGS
jgi:hypothetical protein